MPRSLRYLLPLLALAALGLVLLWARPLADSYTDWRFAVSRDLKMFRRTASLGDESALFIGSQALEKLLKLRLLLAGEEAPETHNLFELCRLLGRDNYCPRLRNLIRLEQGARYPGKSRSVLLRSQTDKTLLELIQAINHYLTPDIARRLERFKPPAVSLATKCLAADGFPADPADASSSCIWLESSRADKRRAAFLEPISVDWGVFYAYLALEKLLKGKILESGCPAPKHHDLSLLCSSVSDSKRCVQLKHTGYIYLGSRYPGPERARLMDAGPKNVYARLVSVDDALRLELEDVTKRQDCSERRTSPAD